MSVGSIRGKLLLVVGDAEIEIGEVSLPLEVTRIAPQMTLGIGTDLEAVTETVRQIFRQHRTENDDD